MKKGQVSTLFLVLVLCLTCAWFYFPHFNWEPIIGIVTVIGALVVNYLGRDTIEVKLQNIERELELILRLANEGTITPEQIELLARINGKIGDSLEPIALPPSFRKIIVTLRRLNKDINRRSFATGLLLTLSIGIMLSWMFLLLFKFPSTLPAKPIAVIFRFMEMSIPSTLILLLGIELIKLVRLKRQINKRVKSRIYATYSFIRTINQSTESKFRNLPE